MPSRVPEVSLPLIQVASRSLSPGGRASSLLAVSEDRGRHHLAGRRRPGRLRLRRRDEEAVLVAGGGVGGGEQKSDFGGACVERRQDDEVRLDAEDVGVVSGALKVSDADLVASFVGHVAGLQSASCDLWSFHRCKAEGVVELELVALVAVGAGNAVGGAAGEL